MILFLLGLSSRLGVSLIVEGTMLLSNIQVWSIHSHEAIPSADLSLVVFASLYRAWAIFSFSPFK